MVLTDEVREVLRAVTLSELRDAEAESEGDPESGHVRADRALCDILRSLGENEVVDAFERVERWYA